MKVVHVAMQGTVSDLEEQTQTSIRQFGLCVAGATVLGLGIGAWKGPTACQEYFAGYLLEQSLSIDNLFVFLLCFNFFKTPKEYQDKVLGFGIYSAAGLRLVMILAGVELVENFKPLLLVFAGILCYSSYNIIFGKQDEAESNDLSENFVVKAINKVQLTSWWPCAQCKLYAAGHIHCIQATDLLSTASLKRCAVHAHCRLRRYHAHSD